MELPSFDPQWSDYRKALYYDESGNWNKAHDIVDQINDRAASHIHAYLHRKEGDAWNANYWYNRANQAVCTDSLATEWSKLWSLYE